MKSRSFKRPHLLKIKSLIFASAKSQEITTYTNASFLLRTINIGLFLILTYHYGNAQLWAFPGASWEYNISSSFATGCESRTYLGDTLFEGKVAQQFSVHNVLFQHINNTLNISNSFFYTTVEDSVVYAWSTFSWNTPPMPEAQWDTLYWFNAQVGDRWWPLGMDSSTCGGTWGMVQVMERELVEINGEELLQLNLSFVDEEGAPGTWPYFPVIQRLGTPGMGLPPGGCMLVEFGYTIRTYTDDEFPLYDTGVLNFCDDLEVDVGEQRSPREIVPYPNPSQGLLNIGMRPDVHISSLAVIDISGRTVLSFERPDLPLDLTGLRSGIYFLDLKIDDVAVSLRFVKQ